MQKILLYLLTSKRYLLWWKRSQVQNAFLGIINLLHWRGLEHVILPCHSKREYFIITIVVLYKLRGFTIIRFCIHTAPYVTIIYTYVTIIYINTKLYY